MNYYLLIKYAEGGTKVEIVVEECLLTHKRKRKVAEVTECEIKVQEVSSQKIRSQLLVER